MSKLPKDCPARVIGARARAIVHYAMPAEHWEYHELTGTDHGIDCSIELIEENEYKNKKIEGQIKGTRNICRLKDGSISFSRDIKTINYGLGSSTAFVLFLVSVDEDTVYYLPIQDYFISDTSRFEQLAKNKTSMNVHIPEDNIVCPDDYDLQQIAKSVYVGGPSESLRKVSE